MGAVPTAVALVSAACCSMKQLRALLFPPERHASPSKGYRIPPSILLDLPVGLIYTPGLREIKQRSCLWKEDGACSGK